MVEQKKKSTIRIIYLYIFALTGLVLMVIGGVNLIDLGLKATIFKQADRDYYYNQPPMPYAVSKLESASNDTNFTEEDRAAIKQWINDYKVWSETQAKIDPVTAQRQRSASIAIAMIIIGLPLYLFHWSIIKKEAS